MLKTSSAVSGAPIWADQVRLVKQMSENNFGIVDWEYIHFTEADLDSNSGVVYA